MWYFSASTFIWYVSMFARLFLCVTQDGYLLFNPYNSIIKLLYEPKKIWAAVNHQSREIKKLHQAGILDGWP